MTISLADTNEWLEPDGRGGFASGTVTGPRTRRYHALLLTATTPPTGRYVLVNGFDAWLETDEARVPLSTQIYQDGIRHPDGIAHLAGFASSPWPTWTYALDNGAVLRQEIMVPHGKPVVLISWTLESSLERTRLYVRPFLSGRDLHALHHENPAFDFAPQIEGRQITWQPYHDVPAITASGNGEYVHDPVWYRNFLYPEERARGLDHLEDLAAPGTFGWDLSRRGAWLALEARPVPGENAVVPRDAGAWVRRTRISEQRRRAAFPTRVHQAADAYLVQRGAGKTIVAGYPWFADWGRDTFIALRGLCLAGGRLDDARRILVAWAREISEGMLPNRFVEQGDAPEFNSVDAALWYVIAVGELLAALPRSHRRIPATERARLEAAVESILSGYAGGTRHGIRADHDGLLAAGAPGLQLTWMDAKVGDWVVTPRIGKPVDIQALWLNALAIGSSLSPRWGELFDRGRQAFGERFWDEGRGCLYDVVDVDHQPGTVDPSFRPNQIFAVGGLPLQLLDPDRARRVVDSVERDLWTPLGLRSLAPGEPGYRARYEGGVLERDGSYHQGTVWPWLAGPFVEAWVRVRGRDPEVIREARDRFLAPLLAHLDTAGIGHVSEIADADAPHTPRGCPFQAWSVGELVRLMTDVLGEEPGDPASTPATADRVAAVRS